jgi:acetyl-CoA acetyltransferase family protein
MNSESVVLLGGVRSPFVKVWTALQEVPAQNLARDVLREALYRCEVSPETVDEVILGCVGQPAEAANVARVAALEAGIPERVPAYTVARNCASGMQALTSACEKILTKQAGLVLAGGAEVMSRIPLNYRWSAQKKFLTLARSRTMLEKIRTAASFRPGDVFSPIAALECGLRDPVSGLNMGETAEILARELRIGRAAQDAFACESHCRAETAWEAGRFAGEVMTLYPPPAFEPAAFDNGIRKGQSMEALARLRPVFDKKFGTVTAGNASQISDGAAALVLASEERAREMGLKPLAKIRGWAYAGCDPAHMGLGPAFACEKLFHTSGMKLADMDLVELNEAFAAQVLACMQIFESEALAKRYGLAGAIGHLDPERLNTRGGAIALGHPVGASGARLVLTLALELKRRRKNLGLAALCVGGGQGGALVLEAA